MEKTEKKNRIFNIATIVIFVAFIFVFSILFIVIPDVEFSEDENRYLQTMPSLSSDKESSVSDKISNGTFLDNLLDGSFTEDFATYMADQFPFRSAFSGIKAISELSIGKKENADVTLGRGDMLIRRNRNTDQTDSDLDANLTAIGKFRAKMSEMNINTVFAVAPRHADIYSDRLTGAYPSSEKERVYSKFDDDTLLLDEILSRHTDEYIYYFTDHHWTTLGAYYAYREIAPKLYSSTIPLGDFTEEIVSEEFYGTSYSKSGMRFVSPDTMKYFILGNEDEFTTTIEDTGSAFKGFYDRSYLEKKDKYSSFISGNHSLVTIKKNTDDERRKLLIIKDSFAHSIAPFLAQEFDLYIVDTRYYKLPVENLITENNIDSVLILCGADTLTDGRNFVTL